MVAAEMRPGDILLHDIMVLHGSDINRHRSLRRVIYYEFRSACQILDSGKWNKDWIEKRLVMLQHALHLRGENPYLSDDELFDYTPSGEWPVAYDPAWQIDLRIQH